MRRRGGKEYVRYKVAAPLAFLADRAVAHIMAVSDDEDALFPEILAAMGQALACSFGAVWEPLPDGSEIACTATWSAPGFEVAEFETATKDARLAPGIGLPRPGRQWKAGSAPPFSNASRKPRR